MKKGKTFIVSGPSGVGKGSVLKVLLEKRKDVYVSVSATTRQPRVGEENGVHYHFLDVDTFHDWMAQDAFLEYAEYVGNFYGTPKRFVDEAMEAGRDVILEIDVQGALRRLKSGCCGPRWSAGRPARTTILSSTTPLKTPPWSWTPS